MTKLSAGTKLYVRLSRRLKRDIKEMARFVADSGEIERAEISAYVKRAVCNQIAADRRAKLEKSESGN